MQHHSNHSTALAGVLPSLAGIKEKWGIFVTCDGSLKMGYFTGCFSGTLVYPSRLSGSNTLGFFGQWPRRAFPKGSSKKSIVRWQVSSRNNYMKNDIQGGCRLPYPPPPTHPPAHTDSQISFVRDVIPDPIFTHPRSRIQKQQQIRVVKKICCHALFL